MRLVIKLLPLAALMAIGLFALSTGPAQRASANVSALTGPAQIDAGDTTKVDLQTTSTDDRGDLTITASSDGTNQPTLSIIVCSGAGTCTGAKQTGTGTGTVVVDTDAIDVNGTFEALTVDFKLSVDCEGEVDTITVTADDEQSAATTGVGAGKSIEIPCSTPGAEISVVLITPPTTLNCNAVTGVVEVLVSDSGGDPVAGASVTLLASAGTIFQGMPVGPTPSNGKVLINYAAPATAGTVTFNASAKIGSGTAVNATSKTTTIAGAACTGAPAPTTAAPAPTTAAPLAAPRTGEAGLAGNGTSWTLLAAIGLLVGSLAGGVAFYRARS